MNFSIGCPGDRFRIAGPIENKCINIQIPIDDDDDNNILYPDIFAQTRGQLLAIGQVRLKILGL